MTRGLLKRETCRRGLHRHEAGLQNHAPHAKRAITKLRTDASNQRLNEKLNPSVSKIVIHLRGPGADWSLKILECILPS
jgi:hypothetical protein